MRWKINYSENRRDSLLTCDELGVQISFTSKGNRTGIYKDQFYENKFNNFVVYWEEVDI